MRRAALLSASLVLLVASAFGGDANIHRSARRIPGRYIVVLESSADTATVAGTARNFKSARVRRSFEHGLKALELEMSDTDAQALALDPRVKFVEEDATVSATTTAWGLDRIDQRVLPLDGVYVSGGTGAGVTVYVVDTGILAGHDDFGGRVTAGFNAIGDNGGSADCNGHGTHVAGVIGGATYGVAKSVTLVPVRALDCNGSGTISNLLAGLDWILQDHASTQPAVVNMSLGGAASTALDNEVNLLIGAGITTVVAAGNSDTDACGSSPARVPAALTVGAMNEADQRAAFSNYGACVDLFAPGSNIRSDFYSSTTATAVSSGTSASAPFVAGVAALCLEKYPDASPSAVSQTILSQATIDALGQIGDLSPNRLLFSLIGSLDDSGTGDSQLLGDPGFEYGTIFWTSDVCAVVKPTGCPPEDDLGVYSAVSRNGNNHATIGGPAKSFHLTSETVTIPASVRTAQVSLYLWVVSKNKKPSASDTLTVEIRDQAGALLATLGTFSNLDVCSTYTKRSFDVTRFRGKSVRISFTGIQNPGPPTWFLLDDVGLNIWR